MIRPTDPLFERITGGGGFSIGGGTGPLDPTLEALVDLDATPGIVTQTGADTFTKRTLSSQSNAIVIDNADGVAGNFTFDLDESQLSGLPQSAIVGLPEDLDNIYTSLPINAAGVWQLPTYTTNGAVLPKTITINADGVVAMHDTVDGSDYLELYSIPAATLDIVERETNFVYADYNGGSPVYAMSTSLEDFDFITKTPIFQIVSILDTTLVSVIHHDEPAKAYGSKSLRRMCHTDRFKAEPDSFIVGEDTGRVITVGDGYLWVMLQRNYLAALRSDTNGATLIYHDGTGEWQVAPITQYNNSQYDTGLGLANLLPNRYAVNWVFRSVRPGSTSITIALGRSGEYKSLAEARNAPLPEISPQTLNTHILVGRAIYLTGASTASIVESISEQIFQSSLSVDHNDLNGIQGGSTAERYHLTQSQYSSAVSPNITGLAVLDGTPGVVVETSAGTFTKRSMSTATGALSITNPSGVAGNFTFDIDETQLSGIPASSIVGLGSLPLNHNTQLSNLQGGENGEYFHLSNDEFDATIARASAGRLWGGLITNIGGGAVNVSAGAGIIKTDTATLEEVPTYLGDGQSSTVQEISWASTNVTLAGVGYNIVFWDASLGALTATLKENFYSVFDFTRDFTVGRVYYDGSTATIRLCGMNLWNFPRRVQMFGEERFPVERASGMLIAATTGLGFSISSGRVWAELVNPFSVNAFTTATRTFTYWYRNGSGGWTSITSQSSINNTQYDNGSGTLATLTAQRYGVHWVYEVHDSTVHVVFGQGDYTLAESQLATVPGSVPGLLASYATLVGKITVQKSASSLTAVQSAYVTQLGATSVTQHNDLSGLQGGSAAEYYHLTTAQHSAAISQNITNLAVLDGTPGFVTETAYGTFAKRALVAGAGITVSNGSGIAANPIVAVNSSTLSGIPQSAIVGITDFVDKSTNQSIAGIKTFTMSPVVPTPTTNFQAATKKYVDDNVGTLDPTLVALAGLDSSLGLVTQTAVDTFTKRTMSSQTSALVLTNPAGTSGNFLFDIDEYGFSGIKPSAIVGISDGIVDITGNQTVNGRKTFTTLPRASSVPTNNADLVNKLYVDTAVRNADIVSLIDSAQFVNVASPSLYNGTGASTINWTGHYITYNYQVLNSYWIYNELYIRAQNSINLFNSGLALALPYTPNAAYVVSNVSFGASPCGYTTTPQQLFEPVFGGQLDISGYWNTDELKRRVMWISTGSNSSSTTTNTDGNFLKTSVAPWTSATGAWFSSRFVYRYG